MLERFETYVAKYGFGWVPFKLWDDQELAKWAKQVRRRHARASLDEGQQSALEAAGMCWEEPVQEESRWIMLFHIMRRYVQESSEVDIPFHYIDMYQPEEQPESLLRWYWLQVFRYQRRELSPDKVALLRGIGLRLERPLTGAAGPIPEQEPLSLSDYTALYRPPLLDWDSMVERLREWRKLHLSTVVPKHAYDDPDLGMWLAETRRAMRRKGLTSGQMAILEDLGVERKPTTIMAKWWSCFHGCRRYKEIHGSIQGLLEGAENVQSDHDFVEGAAFLKRQQELYNREKLTHDKVLVLRELGLKLTRQKGPARKNLHGLLKKRVDLEAIRGQEAGLPARSKASAGP